MALFLDSKRKGWALALHKALHPRSTEPDEVTLNFAFTLMKQATVQLTEIEQLREAVRFHCDGISEDADELFESGMYGLSASLREQVTALRALVPEKGGE